MKTFENISKIINQVELDYESAVVNGSYSKAYHIQFVLADLKKRERKVKKEKDLK